VQRGVFVSCRREDTGWAANALTEALRRRAGASCVFLDNSSIALGAVFAEVIEDAVRRSAVLVVLVGPGWDTARLPDPRDWVRREILLAHECGTRIVPVLVDRDDLPPDLPAELSFLTGLQHDVVRQSHPRDVDVLADQIAALLPGEPTPAAGEDGVPVERAALGRFLRRHLPAAQQWSGNRDRLVNLGLAVLAPRDHLTFAALARIHDGPPGSATVFVTRTDVVVVEVGEDFLVRGEIRFPRALVRRVELVPTLPLFADAVVHTTAGDAVRLQGLFRGQAAHLADHLRA
jgi:hypothetical protein